MRLKKTRVSISVLLFSVLVRYSELWYALQDFDLGLSCAGPELGFINFDTFHAFGFVCVDLFGSGATVLVVDCFSS